MKVYIDINNYQSFECVLTIGMFDGLHKGHQSLLLQLEQKAKELKLPSVVITFWPHPKSVLSAEPIQLLNTLEEKIEKFKSLPIDNLVIMQFDKILSNLTPQEFISTYLIQKFKAKYFLMGYNHHFGKGQYKLDEYVQMAKSCNLPSSRVDKYEYDGMKCSSSEIRKYINASDIQTANKLLGYKYKIQGIVVSGDKIGRKLGYPTANVEIEEKNKIIPPDGVYACYTYINKIKYKSVVNIGFRPTINGVHRQIESHIINYENEIYGNKIEVEFVKKIRPEQKYAKIEDLQKAIQNDINLASEILNN